MDQFFLIDGSSVFFRGYYAIPELRRSDGTPTNALYGYLLTLRSLLQEYNPKGMVVAFDCREKTFREDLFEKYKANRAEPPEDLIAQIPAIKEATELLGIGQVELPGYEADDLIGTLSKCLAGRGERVMVVSGDKDLLQLVNESVTMLRMLPTNKNMIYTPKEVQERYGVTPLQFIDVQALMGDSVDNVPGVPGIGEKTAISLIQEYDSLDGVYENLDKITGKKRKENLTEFKEQAYLSKELVTVHLEVPVEMPDELFVLRKVDTEKLRRFYLDMEFRSFASGLEPVKETEVTADYCTVDTVEKLQEVADRILQKKICAFDTETTSLDVMKARMVGMSLSIEPQQGWYIPFAHNEGRNIERDRALSILKTVLESESVTKIAHNAKYDVHILRNEGVEVKGPVKDTLVASCLVNPDAQSHKLDDLVWRFFNMKMTPITDLIGKGKNQIGMEEVAVETVSNYACEDTDATWRLWAELEPQLSGNGLSTLYEDIEMPLADALTAMERRGIKVDPDVLDEQSLAAGSEMETIAQAVYQSVGREFNLNSPSQLSKILYDDLQLLSGRKRSTRADILEKLADDGVEIARQVLDYRQRQKIKSTYLDALRGLINPATGRVHTTYHQVFANTGRISSTDPNLQNIPIRTDLGRRVRKAFIAEEGYLLLSLDYSQIELRVLAHVSKDPGLLQAFAAGEDIHQRTAAEVFGVTLDEVTSDMRRKAKEINFGLNYGMSAYGLAKRLHIPDKEAAEYIEKYFSRYTHVHRYMDETIAYARENLFVKTILGRKVPTTGIRDSNRMLQENAKRAAINAPIQGSAADLLKMAMVKIHQRYKDCPDEAAILLTVHDELVLEVREDKSGEVMEECRRIMETALPLDVPTPVEAFSGRDWAELK